MISDERGVSRRVVLLGGLAVAFSASACTREEVREPSGGPTPSTWTDVPDLTGSYTIVDPATGSRVEVTVAGQTRSIRANGLPAHDTGVFPNAGNPNSIAPQTYAFDLPLGPTVAAQPTPLVLPQPFGIAVNGVLFDPLAAAWYGNDPSSGWTLEAIRPQGTVLGLDGSNAHVQPTGAYHYHGVPSGLVEPMDASAHGPLVGWAGDGFPIYAQFGYRDPMDPTSPIRQLQPSYRLRDGARPSGTRGPGGFHDGTYTEDYEYVDGLGDLDVANGRYGMTPEYPSGTYYYVLTQLFPYAPRFVAGMLAPSFLRARGQR